MFARTIVFVLFFALCNAYCADNHVLCFVYEWFALFDRNAPHEEFYQRMLDKELKITFPDFPIRSHADFKKWYDGVLATFQKANHDIQWVKVQNCGSGQYKVELVVLWTAIPYSGDTVSFRAHQDWLILRDKNSFKIKEYFVREDKFFQNSLKEKLLNKKEPVFGGFLTIPSYKVIENLALSQKLDFIWLEAEYSEFGTKEVQEMVIACENEKVIPVVRVPQNDPDLIKKYIGTGVKGIVFPNIRNKKEATAAVQTVKYAPEGSRPAGVERANRYLGKFAEYKQTANNNILVVLMIEKKEAVENIKEILEVPGIDVLHIGPYDLSLSMGVSMNSEELKEAISKVQVEANQKGVALGCAASTLEAAKEKQKLGYLFFTIPGDMEMLQKGVEAYFREK